MTEKTSDKLTTLEKIFFLLCFLLYLTWAFNQPFDYAPDEYMRILIPEYIYKFGQLPVGNDPYVVIDAFNASYAYYPTFLGPLISAFFMKVTSMFTENYFSLVVAGRMTSVLFGALTVFFTIKISKRIFNNTGVRWIMVLLVALIPQFVFLSSYINNDVISVCASSIIFYAAVCGVQDGWDKKSCSLLSAGIIICALSYYTAYVWIVCGIIMYFASFLIRGGVNTDKNVMRKNAAIISLVVVVFIGYFFIRNAVLYDGDLFGMRAFTDACEEGAEDFLKPSLRDTAKNLGISPFAMLFDTRWTGYTWISVTYKSFIGVFGQLLDYLPNYIYKIYFGIFLTGSVGIIIRVVDLFRAKKKINHLNSIKYFCLIICIVVPVLLSVYYSYASDYQPQGRYCYSILLALMYFVTKGINHLVNKVKQKRVERVIVMGICLLIPALTIISLFGAANSQIAFYGLFN